MVLETFPSPRARVPGYPVCDGTVHHLPSAGHFLGLFVAPRNTLKTASYHWSRGGLRRAGRPSPSTYTPIILSFTDPAHLAQTPHSPSVRPLPVYTPFSFSSPPPIWQCQPPHLPSFFLSFLPSAPIHPPCRHSISLVPAELSG